MGTSLLQGDGIWGPAAPPRLPAVGKEVACQGKMGMPSVVLNCPNGDGFWLALVGFSRQRGPGLGPEVAWKSHPSTRCSAPPGLSQQGMISADRNRFPCNGLGASPRTHCPTPIPQRSACPRCCVPSAFHELCAIPGLWGCFQQSVTKKHPK